MTWDLSQHQQDSFRQVDAFWLLKHRTLMPLMLHIVNLGSQLVFCRTLLFYMVKTCPNYMILMGFPDVRRNFPFEPMTLTLAEPGMLMTTPAIPSSNQVGKSMSTDAGYEGF